MHHLLETTSRRAQAHGLKVHCVVLLERTDLEDHTSRQQDYLLRLEAGIGLTAQAMRARPGPAMVAVEFAEQRRQQGKLSTCPEDQAWTHSDLVSCRRRPTPNPPTRWGSKVRLRIHRRAVRYRISYRFPGTSCMLLQAAYKFNS